MKKLKSGEINEIVKILIWVVLLLILIGVSYFLINNLEFVMKELLILIFIGLLTGLLSGLLGIGGGIIVVPLLVLLLGYSQHTAQGTSLAMLLPPIGLLAVINYYQNGNVNIKAAIILIITFLIGSFISSKFFLHSFCILIV